MGFWENVGNAFMAIATILRGSREVCYDGIGCFSNETPFNNAGGLVPQDPANMNIQFLLYTRDNLLAPETLTIDQELLFSSNYDGTKKTKFIIHGFRDNGRSWVADLAAAILAKDDVNVIGVDWEGGALLADYSQAAANTRVVGAVVARLITTTLSTDMNTKMEDMHLIGVSLGAQISGYVGSRVPGIGRITGLDPAGLYFEQQDLRVRLDPDDALFVDIIHTDGEAITEGGLGSRISVGDVDFYPNGGRDQPGCSRRKRSHAAIRGICNHSRATRLFAESISDSCYFMASPCTSYQEYLAGSCPCTTSTCVAMGYHVDTNIAHGDYYLSTNAAEPYCMGK